MVVGIFGAATIVLGVTHSFAVAFLSLIVLSAADAVSVFIRATLTPLVTPASARGRVLAVENVFIGTSTSSVRSSPASQGSSSASAPRSCWVER